MYNTASIIDTPEAGSILKVMVTVSKEHYKEYRCKQCNKLQFKGVLVDSEVEVKCKGCKQLTTFSGESSDKLICLVENCPGRVALQK